MASSTSNLASILGENVINHAFTPQLAEFYNKHKESKSLEIIFCSADSDEAAFKEYFASMPWLAFSFTDEEAKVRARFNALKLV